MYLIVLVIHLAFIWYIRVQFVTYNVIFIKELLERVVKLKRWEQKLFFRVGGVKR